MSDSTVTSSDGVVLALHHLGGDGEPLLLCHATGFHGRAYEPLARRLTDRYAVWAPDLRGHGASTAPDNGSFDWGGYVRDVLAIIDSIGGGPVHAVGHSMGGGAILGAAAQRPEAFRQIWVFEPIVIPTPNPEPGGFHMGAQARRRKDDFASREAALMRYAQRGALSVLRADALAAYVTDGFVDDPAGGVRLACAPEHEARTFEATGKPYYDLIRSLAVPTTVARGLTDAGPGPAMFAPAVADALVHGTLAEFASLGHFGPLQDPSLIAEAIMRTFDRGGQS